MRYVFEEICVKVGERVEMPKGSKIVGWVVTPFDPDYTTIYYLRPVKVK